MDEKGGMDKKGGIDNWQAAFFVQQRDARTAHQEGSTRDCVEFGAKRRLVHRHLTFKVSINLHVTHHYVLLTVRATRQRTSR